MEREEFIMYGRKKIELHDIIEMICELDSLELDKQGRRDRKCFYYKIIRTLKEFGIEPIEGELRIEEEYREREDESRE